MVDATEGLLGIEWIEGKSVKQLLPSGAVEESDGEEVEEETSLVADENPLDQFGLSTGPSPLLLFLLLADGQGVFFFASQDDLMTLIGIEIAKMHLTDIIHGDLTTSNMMLRHPSSFHSVGTPVSTELVRISRLSQ